MADDIILSSEPLEYSSSKGLYPSDCGATSVFFGSTRADSNEIGGAFVTKLFYEAYVPMALKELKKICCLMRSKWEGIGPIRIAHRLGDVLVGEVSVVIAVSAQRRSSAIRAMEFALEELKLKVPIWKKEFYSNDASLWKANNPPNPPLVDKRKDVKMEDKQNVQITASNEEIQRRIDSFTQRKRLEVDRSNILEFCNRHYSDENDYSCARTNSVLVRRQGSSSHYRKSKVVNHRQPPPQQSLGSSESPPSKILNSGASGGTEERLHALEAHLLPDKPIHKNVFDRIKALEDRVLYLEGLSPEYFLNSSKTDNFKREVLEDTNSILKDERRVELEKILMDTNLKIHELENQVVIKEEPN